MPKLDLSSIAETNRTGYPPPYDAPVAKRYYRRLAGPAGLADFGVTLCRLEPGGWSSQRHWHSREDEFAVVLSGEAVLVTDDGETRLGAGECAAFPKGDPNAHHFVNRSDADAVLLVMGTNDPADTCTYPDIDLHLPRADGPFTDKEGRPYG